MTDAEAWNVWDRTLDDGTPLASIVSEVIPTPEARLAQWSRWLGWLPGEEGESVLDVACGNGNCRRVFTELKGMEYSGCDISENLLEIARERNPGHDFRQGRAEDLPYEEASFDLTFCLSLLVHLPREYEEPVINELRRVSRRYALVGQMVALNHDGTDHPGKYGIHRRWDRFEDVMERMRALDPKVELNAGRVTGPEGKERRYTAGLYFIFRK